MLTLRQLRYLQALARHRHFGRAADACAVTQPALSMQIQELEGLLGGALVERRRGAVSLTPLGEEVAERGRDILARVQDLTDQARHGRKLLDGPLRLGIIPSIAPYILSDLLPRLQNGYPGLDLQLREAQTEPLLAALAGGELDLLLLSLPIDVDGVETTPLFDDPFLLALPRDQARVVEAADVAGLLREDRLLLLEEGHCLRDQALSFCRTLRPDLRARFGASSLTTLVQLVAAGHGMTLLPAMSLEAELGHRPGITAVALPPPAPSRAIGLAARRGSPRRRDFEEMGRLVVEAAAALRARTRPLRPDPAS